MKFIHSKWYAMKTTFSVVCLVLFMITGVSAQMDYNQYFTTQALRLDFILGGNDASQSIYLLELKKENNWGGSLINLLDKNNYGTYRCLLKDKETQKILYSRGFCTLFEEWRTTPEAKSVPRSFFQSIQVPFPKREAQIVIEHRKKNGVFEELSMFSINPEDYFINPEKKQAFNSYKIHDSGKSSEKVDLVFLAEGYKEEEIGKFLKDAKRLKNYLFTQKPFDGLKDKFNIWVVESISKGSGPDVPGKGLYSNTIMGSTFYTFGIERYMSIYDYLSVRDVASNVPYDHICVLVNSSKYGGGGIYNHFTVATVDHELSSKVFVHELGHGFAGLGDEYYTSEVAYEDFYDLDVEPWQPNLTTMKNFDRKWKDMVDRSVPIPTPNKEKYKALVGVFEGGGYVSKGVFRPALDCRMKSNQSKDFCPVCQKAIIDMVKFLCGE